LCGLQDLQGNLRTAPNNASSHHCEEKQENSTDPGIDIRPIPVVSEIAAKAAWLVHAEELSIKNAAELLNVSRFAVARLL
jgi:hypothetical protein